MNPRWHERHPMPKNAGLAARVAWHVAHRKACACRPVPPSILAALGEAAPRSPAHPAAPRKLGRPLEPMPSDVRRRLSAQRLTAAYRERPPYQRNDYLRWFARAKLPATREKRVQQMLAELAQGGVYMKMKWSQTGDHSVGATARPARKRR